MKIRERIRQALASVRSGASGVKQVANLKVDLHNLEGRREQLYRTIGRRAHDLHKLGRGVPDFDRLVREIDAVDEAIDAKKTALRDVRQRPAADPDATPA